MKDIIHEGLKETVGLQDERIDQLEDALERIEQWSRAYPVDVFHEPTKAEWAKANEVLKAAGLSLDAMRASNMRHVITQVGDICREALKE